MLSPWALAVLAVLLLVLFIWLLLGERNVRLEADRQARVTAGRSKNLATDGQKLNSAQTVIPSTAASRIHMVEPTPAVASAGVGTPVEPAVILIEPAPPAPVEAMPIVASAPAAKPAAAAEVEEVRADDLQIIEGIGPKISMILQAAGIHTFAQLAALEPSRITVILHAGGIRLADPRTWPEQARLAAAGDLAGLRALQDRLKGGREVA